MKHFATATLLFAAAFVFAADVPITHDELVVVRTQDFTMPSCPAIYKEPWKKYFADDCMFADEKGRIFDKPKLIADITPLPAGILEQLKSRTPRAELSGTPPCSVTTRMKPRRSSAKT